MLMRWTQSMSARSYPICAAALLSVQYLIVVLLAVIHRTALGPDATFWLLPMRRLVDMTELGAVETAVAFAIVVAAYWLLAWISFRRADRSKVGYVLASLSVVPAVQLWAVLLLAVYPVRAGRPAPPAAPGVNVAHVIQGVSAGMAIIVFAVLVSAVTFGAYGWGLFVLTPFTVGLATAYIANRQVLVDIGNTLGLVLAAAALGCFALVMLALEGILCILLAAPLGVAFALVGGVIGRAMARVGHRRGKPLLTVALLPAVFVLEAAVPPAAAIDLERVIEIAAPPERVWSALISSEPIRVGPGLVAAAGLAYPQASRLSGHEVGSERLGFFSTGVAHERITEWEPGRRLAFDVVDQPPAMEEMSPYRRVHAPHVSGYFETRETVFELVRLPGNRTRLTIRAAHELRIDPVPYWEPVARWAVKANVSRVLLDIKQKAEAARG